MNLKIIKLLIISKIDEQKRSNDFIISKRNAEGDSKNIVGKFARYSEVNLIISIQKIKLPNLYFLFH